jgi:nitroreductase
METLEAVFTRRSIREFSQKVIEADLLKQVLQAGAAAPSAGNLQAWGFVVIRSPERLEGLRSLAPGIIGKPAAVVAICIDAGRADLQGGGMSSGIWIDVGIALQNMLLAAHSLGLGACPIGSFHHQAVATYLGLPEGVQPALLLALGYPKRKPTSPGRRPLADVLFNEHWGVPYE